MSRTGSSSAAISARQVRADAGHLEQASHRVRDRAEGEVPLAGALGTAAPAAPQPADELLGLARGHGVAEAEPEGDPDLEPAHPVSSRPGVVGARPGWARR